jgi:hypothetical protein
MDINSKGMADNTTGHRVPERHSVKPVQSFPARTALP